MKLHKIYTVSSYEIHMDVLVSRCGEESQSHRRKERHMITINRLQVKYKNLTALNITQPITFEKGDKIGIIGSNGAGKTTLINALTGISDYTGSISTQLKPEDMAVHLQFNEYVNTMPIKDIMEAVLSTSIKKDKKLQELIRFFEFEECLKKKYSMLSGGQKQRFTIILVMMQEAPITFYDEVTSGLDFETRQKLMGKLAEWYEKKEATLCIVSHYYEELEHLAEKLLILDCGNVVAFGKKEELFSTYCGRSVLVLNNTEENRKLTEHLNQILAPEKTIAISCSSEEYEQEAVTMLLKHNVNFKRSNNDIELIFINAKDAYYRNREEKL